MSEPTREELALQICNNSFLAALEHIVHHLRRTADQVERLRTAYEEDPIIDILSGQHEAIRTAYRVLHEVLWMVPNLHMDGMPEMASEIAEQHRKTMCPTCGASALTFIDGDCPKCNPPIETEE